MNRQHRNVIRLVVGYLATLFALVTLNFLLPRVMPGNPIEGLLSQASPHYIYDAHARAQLMSYYGLNQPLLAQYGHYLDGLIHGNLGRSIDQGLPVTQMVLGALPWTLLLVGTASLLSAGVGAMAGIVGGWRRDRADRGLAAVLISAQNFPSFVLASLALFAFGVQLHWFPVSGSETPFTTESLPQRIGDIAHHLVLPLLVLSIGLVAQHYLVMRAAMVGEIGSDYFLLGRAKGLPDRWLKYRYCARNSLLPWVSLAAIQIGTAVTGDIFVERVFSYPGMGNLMFNAITVLDYPVIQGSFLVLTVAVLTANLGAELLYRRLDPRVTA
jgi:peptide/nickel transport system permease protein